MSIFDISELQSRPFWGGGSRLYNFFILSLPSTTPKVAKNKHYCQTSTADEWHFHNILFTWRANDEWWSSKQCRMVLMILALTKDGLVVAMVKLAVSTCNRDWGQNTLHCWSPRCKILIWKALIAKCATTIFSCCLQGEGSLEGGGASSPFWQLCWLTLALAKWSFILCPRRLHLSIPF